MKTNLLPNQICASVWLPQGAVAVATFAERNLEGIPRIDLKYFEDPTEVRLPAQSVCLTAPVSFNFQTRRLFLDAQTLEQNDAEVAAFLIQAQQSGFVLADGQPLLESSLEETVAQMTRLPNETVALTQMPRTELEAVQNPTRELFFNGLEGEKKAREEARFAPAQIQAETPLRAIVRAYLCEVKPAANNRATVFLVADEFGFAIGLWNSSWGLFFERSEPLLNEFESEDADDNSAFYSDFLSHALQTSVQTAHEVAGEMGFDGLERIVVCVPQHFLGLIQPLADELSEMEELPVEVSPETVENQIGRGLLYAYIPNNPLPFSDLCRDLYVRLIDNSLEAERLKRAHQAKARANAAMAVLLPFVLLIAFIVGAIGHYGRQSAMLAVRKSSAEAEARRLKPITDARNNYIEHFRWRESFLRQILSLRDRQTLAISFLPEVDGKTVMANDGRFAFSELKMNVNGAWSMRGISGSEEGVTNFIRGLEYAVNAKEEPIFTNLAPELKLGTDDKLAASANYKSSIPTVPRGLIGWEIKGNYTPLASMAPKPAVPNAPQPNQPAANVPAPNAAVAPNTNTGGGK